MLRPEQIGISTNVLDESANLPEVIERLCVQFTSIEIEFDKGPRTYLDMPDRELERAFDRLLCLKRQRQLYFSVHAPYLGRSTDISALDEEERVHAVGLMLRTLRLSAALGVARFTCHPGYLPKAADSETRRIEQLRRSLAAMVDSAQQLGIKICLENTGNERPNYIVLTAEQEQRLCAEFGVGITLDLIHFTTFQGMDEDYYRRLAPLLPHVHNVHFADMNVPRHRHLPLGKGTYPFDEVISFMAERGYSGNYIVEERAPTFSEAEYLHAAAAYRLAVAERQRAREIC